MAATCLYFFFAYFLRPSSDCGVIVKPLLLKLLRLTCDEGDRLIGALFFEATEPVAVAVAVAVSMAVAMLSEEASSFRKT